MEPNSGPTIKAAKNDDAAVKEQQGDVLWSVDSLILPGSVAAKICIPGSYTPATHGRLFDGLRTLALRWYRRRILQSLLRYLRSHYGKNRTYSEVVAVGEATKRVLVSTWVKLRYQFRLLG